jgi:hypothetical protein
MIFQWCQVFMVVDVLCRYLVPDIFCPPSPPLHTVYVTDIDLKKGELATSIGQGL